MTTETTHTCSYSCERPGCIRAQRDELVARLEALAAAQQRSAVVDEAMVERIAALLHEEATDEPWTVAGVEHPGPDRDYYRGLARKVLALASTPPGAHSDDLPALLDNLMRAAFDDGDKGREKFSGATMAAREAVLAHVRYASAPPSAAAGVDWPIIVEGLRLADHFFDGDDHYWQPASKVRAAYRAALAAQQQGGRTDD